MESQKQGTQTSLNANSGASSNSNLNYENMSKVIMDAVLKNGGAKRIISVDLETKIMTKDDFLTGERILAIGVAHLDSAGKIAYNTFVLAEETDDAEAKLLEEFGKYCMNLRPLVLAGYNISGYDFPLLCLKLKWYETHVKKKAGDAKPNLPREYWALKDALTMTYILDLMHPLRYEIGKRDNTTPKYKSLAAVLAHEAYAHLPLMRRKGIADATDTMSKGERIYNLWREKNPSFVHYLEGDVHDTLMLAREMYKF